MKTMGSKTENGGGGEEKMRRNTARKEKDCSREEEECLVWYTQPDPTWVMLFLTSRFSYF